MRSLKKFAAVAAVAAAAIVSFAAPANAAIYIGLQSTGVNGGAVTQVATGANFASFADAYGAFELTFTSGAQGVYPTVLGSTSHVQNNEAGGGTLDVYVTRTGLTGPVPAGFFSAFTSNVLTTGWTLTERTYYNVGNAIFDTSNQLSSYTFVPPGLGTFSHLGVTGSEAGSYSVTQRYTIVAPTNGESLASISMAAVPEPGTWALMIIGFGGAGAMLRSRRRQLATLA